MQKVLRQDGTIWFAVASMMIHPKWTGEYSVTIAPREEPCIDEWVEIQAYEMETSDGEIVWREMH